MYRGFITHPNVAPTWGVVENAKFEFETFEAARKATEAYLAVLKPQIPNGYHAFVVDMDTFKILSHASTPKPAVHWHDVRD